jgi:hypothetical protein
VEPSEWHVHGLFVPYVIGSCMASEPKVIALGHRPNYRLRPGKRKRCRRERQPLAVIIRRHSHQKETEGTARSSRI